MNGEARGKSPLTSARETLAKGVGALRRALAWYDRRLRYVYSPNLAALVGALLVLLIAVVTLFVPPFVGIADDGSLSAVMAETGLGYRARDLEAPVGAYFVRVYQHSSLTAGGLSTHRGLIRAAMRLDDRFTRDNLFDVRFLAALYLLLYLPAVWLFLRGMAARVRQASEATFLTLIGALVLGDASLLASFNSLYPEALWAILIVYCLGFFMALQHADPRWLPLGFAGTTVAGCALALTESHCAAPVLVLAAFMLRQIMLTDGTRQTRVMAVAGAVALLAASLLGWNLGANRFTEASRLHAMTNGVLLRAEDPEEALAEFGIEPRFETLADMSSYDSYPYALSGNPELRAGFMDRYDTGKLLVYYLRHPLDFFGLIEIGIRPAFNPVRNYVGNYEREVGLPERARNPLFILYSNFKANSMPRTFGFLMIVAIVYAVLFRRPRGLQARAQRFTPRERQIMLDTCFCALAMAIAHLAAIIVLSGTAELERYQMIFGTCVDGVMLLFTAEILHRLNIVGEGEK